MRRRGLFIALLVVPVLLAAAGAAQAAIYFANDTAIGRAHLDGDNAEMDFIPGLDGVVTGVGVNDTHVYWAEDPPGTAADGSVGRANIDGTGVETIITGLTDPLALAISANHIYVAQAGDVDLVSRANLDGTGFVSSFIVPEGEPRGLATNATHVFWSNWMTATEQTDPGSWAGRANLDGTGVLQHFRNYAVAPTGLATSATHLYQGMWGRVSGNVPQVNRGSLADPPTGNINFIRTPKAPKGIAVYGGFVYWSNANQAGVPPFGPGTSYGRANLDGTQPIDHFIEGVTKPDGIALNDIRGAGATLVCSPLRPIAGNSTTCTASVADVDAGDQVTPTGTVELGASSGQLSAGGCALTAFRPGEARCSVTFTPSQQGVTTLSVSYSGDEVFFEADGGTSVTAAHNTSTGVACAPLATELSSTTCTVTVTDVQGGTPPSGSVNLDATGWGLFEPDDRCTVAPSGASASSCTFTYTPTEADPQVVTAAYLPSSPHTASSGQRALTVGLPPDDDPDPPPPGPPGPPIGPIVTPPPAAPSNAFSFGSLRRNRAKGTATLRVRVPGAGALALTGPGVRRSAKRADAAGTVTLTVRAKGKALRRLNRRGRAKVRLSVTFTPDGGAARTSTKNVTLQKRR